MQKISFRSIAIAAAGLIAVILIAAAIFYRNDIFQARLDPGIPFQTYVKPTAPDYADAESWIVRPDLSQDSYELDVLGDVFVVVPTVYNGGEHWNNPVMDAPKSRARIERIVRPNYVAPYRDAGRVFAPFYREASLYTYMTAREDARRAQNLAYSDIRRSFEVFLENSPPERPIILAGHDQGAQHVQRLLADYFQGELSDRLAAAYVIGHPLPLDSFDDPLSSLSPCETETDTNCVVAFGAFMPGDDLTAKRFLTRLMVYEGGEYDFVAERPILCTNPLLWNRSADYAPRRLHLGGLAATGLDPETRPAPLAKQTGAQCQDGILYVDNPRSGVLRRPIKFGGKFQTLPSNLFYQDLKVNAAKRVQSLYDSGRLPRRAQKLDDFEIIEIDESPVTPADE